MKGMRRHLYSNDRFFDQYTINWNI
jgi:hypothetical protein